MPAVGGTGDVKRAEGVPTADDGVHVAGDGTIGPENRWARLGRSWRQHRRLWACGLLLVVVTAGIAPAIPSIQVWYHFRAARAALQRYHNPEAIRHLQACLQLRPMDADALLLAARAARRARAYDEAQRALEKYQQVRGLDDAGSLEELLLSAERDVEQVADVCRHYVERGHPDTPLILEALTRGYLRQYRLGEARFCLDRWLEREPENPQANCLEGQLHLDYEQTRALAVETFRHAVQLDPDHEEARLGLAVALLETKNFVEAAEQLEDLLKRQPDNLRVQVGLAECREAVGDGAEALQLVDRVLAQQPQFLPALTLRGRLLTNQGQYAAAEGWLRQALRQNPGDHQACYDLILCLGFIGKEEEATGLKQNLQQMEEDVRRFNEIVTREMAQRPRDPDLHCALGQLLLRSGHRDEGVRWLNNALRLDPQHAGARKALTEHYQQAESKRQQPD